MLPLVSDRIAAALEQGRQTTGVRAICEVHSVLRPAHGQRIEKPCIGDNGRHIPFPIGSQYRQPQRVRQKPPIAHIGIRKSRVLCG